MIWYTSDQHYGHLNVIKYCSRPFATIGEMDEELIRRHNSVVKPEDVVCHLGDFSLNKRAPKEILPRLNGIHHLLAIGNHDWCHPVRHKNTQNLEKHRRMYYDAGFKTLSLSNRTVIAEKLVEQSHFPYYDPDPRFDQRYADFRPKDEGLVLLHGHVHQHWKVKRSANGSLMINVGVDVWNFYPVSHEQISVVIRHEIV